MVRKERYIGLGLDTDTSPDKRKPDTFYDSENIQIINNGRGMSILPIQGETPITTTFPTISYPDTLQSDGVRKVVGTVYYNNYIYFFTHTHAILKPVGTAYSYLVDELFSFSTITNTVTRLAYWQGVETDVDNRWFNDTTKLDILLNYETPNLIKLYWVDGVHPLRSINVSTISGVITANNLNFIKEVDLVAIATTIQSGGALVAGTIQYVYNYYNLYESQSSLSPVSNLVSISSFFKGYESKASTGLSVKLDITDVDTTFDAIKIYSIHYQELNQTPLIKLIYDERIGTSSTLTIYDDGNRFVAELSLTDLLSINPIPYIPNTLAIKRERLFLGNYNNTNFNPDVDMRAYSFDSNGTSSVTRLTNKGTTANVAYADIGSIAEDHDCINADYNTYKYQYNSGNVGGTGVNISYTFVTTSLSTTVQPPKSLKRWEIYRIGIILYNKYGQKSPVKWIADFKVPNYGNYAVGLTTQLTAAGESALLAAGTVNYQICIVERRPEDRTIISQGFIVPACKYTINGTSTHESPYWYPYYTVKDIMLSGSTAGANINEDYYMGKDWQTFTLGIDPRPMQNTAIQFFYSTDTIFETNSVLPTKVRILGEAVRQTGTGHLSYTEVKQHRDNELKLNATYNEAEPYWGDPGWHNPYHIMGQTDDTGVGDTEIVVYSVMQTKYYDILSLNGYSDTTNVVTLDTGYPAAAFLTSGDITTLDPSDAVSNSATLNNLVRGSGPLYLATSYISSFSPTIALNFSSATWHRAGGSSVNYSAFDAYGIYAGSSGLRGLPLVELLQDVPNQYGGSSYEAKLRNEYLPLGGLHTIDDTIANNDYIGDIWIGTLSVNRTDGLDDKTNGQMGIYEYVHVNYIENNHNVYARSDYMHSWTQGYFNGEDLRYFRIEDNHKLLGAYNQVPNVFTNYPTPLGYQDQENYPVSVIGSNAKVPGELLDSWLTYNPANTKLLEGQYGYLTKLHNLNGDLLGIQTTGIVLLEIEPRVQTIDSAGMAIQLGIGSLFYNHKYLVTNSGTTRKDSICEDGKQLYYWDSNINVLCSLHEGKLSTIKTVKTLVDSLPEGPHTSTFFNKRDHIYFQYDSYVLVYDLLLQKFVSKYTFLEDNEWLVAAGNILYQFSNTGTALVINSQFTGSYKASSITYSMCPDPVYEKVFHNLEYRLNGTNFTSVNVTNERGSTSGTVTPDIATKFDIHRLHLPRVAASRERFRGITIYVKLSNISNYSLDDIVLMYNIKG